MDFGSSDMSHLTDDSVWANLELAAKERMKTKEINAREDRAFQYASRVIDRARQVAQKSHHHEMQTLRKNLFDIHAKTPNLRLLETQQSRGSDTRRGSLRIIPLREYRGSDPRCIKPAITETKRRSVAGSQIAELSGSVSSVPAVPTCSSLASEPAVPSCSSDVSRDEIMEEGIDGHAARSQRARSEGNIGDIETFHIKQSSLSDSHIGVFMDKTGEKGSQKDDSDHDNWLVTKLAQQRHHAVKRPSLFPPIKMKRKNSQDSQSSITDSTSSTKGNESPFKDTRLKPSTRHFLKRATNISNSLENLYNQRKMMKYPSLPAIADGSHRNIKPTPAQRIMRANEQKRRVMFTGKYFSGE